MTDQEIKLACYQQTGSLDEAKELYEWVSGEVEITGLDIFKRDQAKAIESLLVDSFRLASK